MPIAGWTHPETRRINRIVQEWSFLIANLSFLLSPGTLAMLVLREWSTTSNTNLPRLWVGRDMDVLGLVSRPSYSPSASIVSCRVVSFDGAKRIKKARERRPLVLCSRRALWEVGGGVEEGRLPWPGMFVPCVLQLLFSETCA
ncbi:hypothetical protein BU24DRAFT_422596 [Aaosphaeria arxii CBS 175.79]|uniref:Uncharacterized protein n=1 Tax=Aaosphaeria arxii CBS 175.79 TaxID=1450172 RepID=A0A6A5XUD9_9PLEO|nr:uncharacterized protein BU24DRAFT_422596 [Aaosphaeria arxii CBS 175.79]KAF2016260.1 hypothetical protein BU24DRAFT_422596 [Aaosphaeria arxii CBS 175.79]